MGTQKSTVAMGGFTQHGIAILKTFFVLFFEIKE